MRLGLIGLVAAVLAGAGAASASVVHGGSFPCQWKWDLEAGLRAGYVTAAQSANCAGRSGSLTLSARLLRWNAKTRRWHTDKAQTQTWRDLHTNRYVELQEKCKGGIVRATFAWILRDAGGSVVARNSVDSGRYRDPGPGCKIGLR